MASIQTWMNRFKVAHGEVYDYSKFTTTKSTELRTIICRIHGEFQQNPYNHAKGHGCDQCAKIVRGGKKRKSHDEFISEVSKLYGDLVSFEKTQYVTSQTPIMVTCKKHGDFITSPHNFRRGKLGCHLCAGDNRGKYPTQQLESQKTAALRIEKSRESIIDKARKVHGNRYEYDSKSYTSAKVPFTVICKEHGPFQVRLGHHLKRGHGCPICANSTSAGEYAIGEFIESLDIPLEKRNRAILSGREIDIYLPDQKLGIEFNGAYWHTDDKLHKLSLKDKWQLCLDKGIRLIHIILKSYYNAPDFIIKVRQQLKQIILPINKTLLQL
ncbi:MAG: hypothetical protein KA974_01885 [Saprospiraceae bacterium]|nr:hypothetical protein [Saprospiraceae bacterium]